MVFYTEERRGTIQPQPNFDAEEACIKLNDSMEGIGTDEQTLTNTLLSYSFKQRQDIRKKYKDVYNRDLYLQLETELTGNYEQVVLALMSDPQEYILECIHEAVTLTLGEGIMKKFQKATFKKGIAADEYTLMGLLIPRPNREIEELKKAYKLKYKKPLEKRIATSDNLSMDFRRLIIAMIDCKREEASRVDSEKIFKDLMKLVGAQKEEAFHVVFHERSFLHLRQLFDGYKDLTGKEIDDLVTNSTYSLDLKQSYIAILTLIRDPAEYFAERLYDAMDGVGTDDDLLIQVMVLRSEIDLVYIIRAYERKYGVPIGRDISGDTSGDYEDILLKMLRVPESILKEEAEEKERLEAEEKARQEAEEAAKTENGNADETSAEPEQA